MASLRETSSLTYRAATPSRNRNEMLAENILFHPIQWGRSLIMMAFAFRLSFGTLRASPFELRLGESARPPL